MKSIMQTIDGQPATGSFQTSFLTMIKIIRNMDSKTNNKPTIETAVNGAEVNAAIPSNAYILKKLVKKNKYLFFLYFILFVILSGVCIFLLGGWDEYIKVFGVYK